MRRRRPVRPAPAGAEARLRGRSGRGIFLWSRAVKFARARAVIQVARHALSRTIEEYAVTRGDPSEGSRKPAEGGKTSGDTRREPHLPTPPADSGAKVDLSTHSLLPE